MHAAADAGFVQKVHGDLFDYARAHAAKNVVRSLTFKNDVIDTVFVQELTEQQPCRPGADNDDLGAHGLFIASPAKIESFCILFARERPCFVTAAGELPVFVPGTLRRKRAAFLAADAVTQSKPCGRGARRLASSQLFKH
jgi:hypothetical protein